MLLLLDCLKIYLSRVLHQLIFGNIIAVEFILNPLFTHSIVRPIIPHLATPHPQQLSTLLQSFNHRSTYPYLRACFTSRRPVYQTFHPLLCGPPAISRPCGQVSLPRSSFITEELEGVTEVMPHTKLARTWFICRRQTCSYAMYQRMKLFEVYFHTFWPFARHVSE
jgi:hypothetical protein